MEESSLHKLKVSHNIVKICIPQGSTLWSLLFLLYINDLILLIFWTLLFGDNTTISPDPDVKMLEIILNQELVNISNWLLTDRLSLNI